MSNLHQNFHESNINENEIKVTNLIESFSNLTQRKNLAQWALKEISNTLYDIFPHFLLSFKSIHTRRNYKNDIQSFYLFHANKFSIDTKISDITEIDIINWHDYLLNTKKLSQESIRRHLNSLSSLFNFCLKRKLISKNPLRFISKPKVRQQGKTNTFSEQEIKNVLSYLETKAFKTDILSEKQNKSSVLKYTVLFTLFTVGMRANELCQLKIQDLEFDGEHAKLHIKSKGNMDYFVYLHEKTYEVLKVYIEKYRSQAQENEFLFLRAQNVKNKKPLTQKALYLFVQECVKELGIEKKLTTHSCRASLATLLHHSGVPLVQIQTLLNHKNLSTTHVYLRKAEELENSAALKLDLNK